jgi:Family of unknown function (DUF5994)
MASPAYRPDSAGSFELSQAQFDPNGSRHPLLDGDWWPSTTDLGAELCALVPLLDHVRGPVTRLLLSAGGWATRPHHIITDGRTVTVGYLAGQSPATMTVLCADGGTFTMRVSPPGPAPGAPGWPETGRDKDGGKTEEGRLGLVTNQAVR